MAREGYLVNAGEETIHPDAQAPMSPKQKRQNWWYYNKFILLGVVLVALLVGSIIYSVASQVKPDYTIALMTSYTMPESGLQQLRDCITPYADDRNGDGRVQVSVVNYVISANETDYQMLEASMVKFTADASTNTSMIYLHDETSFQLLENNFEGFFQYNDGTPMPAGATDYENAMIPWEDVKAFAEFTPTAAENDSWTAEDYQTLFEMLRVSLRAAEGSSIERSEEDMAYYEDSMALFDRLKNDEKLVEEEVPEWVDDLISQVEAGELETE